MSNIENIDERLALMKDAFKEASVDDDPFALPDPGVYQATFYDVDFFESKDNVAFLKLQYMIRMDAKYDGKIVDMIYCLEPSGGIEEAKQKLGFLKRDLAKLGIPVESDEFDFAAVRPGSPMWDELTDVPVELAIVDSKKINPTTNKPYRNAYLNERLGSVIGPLTDVPAQVDPAVTVTPGASTEDIPFEF